MEQRKQIITLLLYIVFAVGAFALKDIDLKWLDLFLLFWSCSRVQQAVEKMK